MEKQNPPPQTIAMCFERAPKQWGLRGDPHLWNEMRERFAETPIPETWEELIALIETAFEEMTQHPITEKEHFYLERLNHGGMSGGFIAPEYWRGKAVPLIREQFDSLKK